METVSDFIFLGSKITADGDCSHEIKNTLEATNSRITEAEDRISELEDRMIEINESGMHDGLTAEMNTSRQEHWSGLPFPSPMHESEK